MRRQQPREGQVGSYWLSKKPGREGTNDPWCKTWYDERTRQTRRVSLGTSDVEEASRSLADWVVLNERPVKGRPEDVMIETVLLTYWEDHGKNVASPRQQRAELAKWQQFWTGMTVSAITPAAQREFRKWLGEGRLRPSSIDKTLSAGRAALNRAFREQELLAAPHISLIETEEDRRSRDPMGTPITIPEMGLLFDAVRYRHAFVFMLLLANTLARSSAIFDLCRSQFDDVHDRLDLNPAGRRQTKKYRPIIPVTSTLRPWLAAMSDQRAHFITFEGNRLNSVRGSWETIRARTGLNHLSAYSFRHGMAREMRKRKVPLEQISLYLGHLPKGSDKTTSIYAPFDPDYCVEAKDAIDDVMNQVRKLLKSADLDNPNAEFKIVDGRAGAFLSRPQRELRNRLLRAGKPIKEIADKLGVSTTAIYKARQHLKPR